MKIAPLVLWLLDSYHFLFFNVCGAVDFDHFHILRAIGKGAFGKVSYSVKMMCIRMNQFYSIVQVRS